MINDIKDLKALFKLCRAQGVTNIKLNGVEVNFGDLPQEYSSTNEQIPYEDPLNKYVGFPDRELSPEELAFFSAGGLPEDFKDKEAIG